MPIDNDPKVRGAVRSQDLSNIQETPVETGRPAQPALPTEARGVEPPSDPTRVAGAESVKPALPTDAAPAARKIDLVKLLDHVGKGQAELKVHLTPGMKLAGAKIPESTYAILELAVKANGEIDFEKCKLRFENAKGEKVELDRQGSIFDVVGAGVSREGHVEVDIAFSPFDVDVTEKLLGVSELPKRLSEVMALVAERGDAAPARPAGKVRIVDTKDVSYSGFFVANKGTLDLAGRSSVELHQDARIFIKGNAAAGMLQVNSAENGASLNLESKDGNFFKTGPSTVNVRVGFKAEDNSRFFMFHDSTLNDASLSVKIGEQPVTVKVGKFELDGHDKGAVAPDARYAAMETKAKALGGSVPPSEVAGPDIERVVIGQFIQSWPLNDIAEGKPERLAQLLKDPKGTKIPGLLGLFRGSIVSGVEEGLDKVPYFIRDKLQAMPTDDLALCVQRAVVADIARRWSTASDVDQKGSSESPRDQLVRSYRSEVAQLATMLQEKLNRTQDKAAKAALEAQLAGFVDPKTHKPVARDVGRDWSILQAGSEDLRPSPELPPYDAMVYAFERDGSLDHNLRDSIMPALEKKLAGHLPAGGEVKVDKLALKPGIEPMAFLALSHPLVKQAMRDPKVRALANEGRKAVEQLYEGYGLMRLEDADPKTQHQVVTKVLAALKGIAADKLPAAAVDAVLGDPAQRTALFDQLKAKGEGTFTAGKEALSNLFVRVGGMEPNGRAEAFLNTVIDEVIKADVLPKDKADALNRDREKYISLAVNTARAALWIRLQPDYRDWPQVGAALMSQVSQADGARTAIGTDAFRSELEGLSNTHFVEANAVKSLKDGPAFFAEVKKLIEETPKPGPIFVNYWGIYDDVSGHEFSELLIQKQKEGYALSVIVDGKTMLTSGIGKKTVLPALQAAGVPIVTWNDPNQPPVGNHIKYIVTPKGVVTGGSNIGDNYTHSGTPETRWSDSNVRITGPVAMEYFKLHKEILAQVGMELPAPIPARVDAAPAGAAGRVAIIHEKPADLEHPILLATLKLLEGAKPGETVRIKNAYFVMTDPIRLGIERAVARGVNLEIFTNSPTSVDEPTVALPILDSCRNALRIGERAKAEKGDKAGSVRVFLPHLDFANPANSDKNTVHDKITLAGSTSAIMTYNMHPRSETLENEACTLIDDPATAAAQLERWNAGMVSATEITSSSHPIFSMHKLDYKDLALEVFKNLF